MSVKPPSKPIKIPSKASYFTRDGSDCVKLHEFMELFDIVHDMAVKLDKIEEVIIDTVPAASNQLGDDTTMDYDEYIPLPASEDSDEQFISALRASYAGSDSFETNEDDDDEEEELEEESEENSILTDIVDLTHEDYDPKRYYV